ncbi:PilT/PilU family type 4a pilus ATPase [Candidatus Gracilibacteria bacterium]|nr:PilT/PilU family type 4a pilus ATPase [Candidatus Gracilibacteria bacterium]
MNPKFILLIEEVIKNNISDLHLGSNEPPYIRNKTGGIVPVAQYGVINDEEIHEIAESLIGRPFEENTIDVSFEHQGTRFRVNISHTISGMTIALRTIPSQIPEPAEITLPNSLLDITNGSKGIILVTGPTGSGKSTTMATMLEYINRTSRRHIITLEDPVEFVYKNKLSLIHQRELGKHFDNFASGIRSILREDPDVVVVGEMRDLATIEAAITLAETGHIVLSTLHTNDTVQTVDRIIQSFPSTMQNQIRMQLGLTMRAIVSQILLPKADGTGRVVAREIMFNNDSIRNLIIRGDTQHLYSTIEISKQDNMILMDESLQRLVENGTISESVAKYSMRDPSRLQMFKKK